MYSSLATALHILLSMLVFTNGCLAMVKQQLDDVSIDRYQKAICLLALQTRALKVLQQQSVYLF